MKEAKVELEGPCRVFRHGWRSVYVDGNVDPDTVLAALDEDGEILKESKKAVVRRVDRWVVKQSGAPKMLSILRHTARRNRYRRGWLAARRLMRRGVGAPKPVAYVETGLGRIVTGNAFISEYLYGCTNVEECVRTLVHAGAGPDTLATFLDGLAGAVNDLVAAGAYHEDLSGKNIFTRDGSRFYFIDLDAVELDVPYTDDRRLKNLVQLYDSFCDELTDAFLAPFIACMLAPDQDPRVWMPKVRAGQSTRRSRFEARRRKHPVLT